MDVEDARAMLRSLSQAEQRCNDLLLDPHNHGRPGITLGIPTDRELLIACLEAQQTQLGFMVWLMGETLEAKAPGGTGK